MTRWCFAFFAFINAACSSDDGGVTSSGGQPAGQAGTTSNNAGGNGASAGQHDDRPPIDDSGGKSNGGSPGGGSPSAGNGGASGGSSAGNDVGGAMPQCKLEARNDRGDLQELRLGAMCDRAFWICFDSEAEANAAAEAYPELQCTPGAEKCGSAGCYIPLLRQDRVDLITYDKVCDIAELPGSGDIHCSLLL